MPSVTEVPGVGLRVRTEKREVIGIKGPRKKLDILALQENEEA